MADVLVTSCPYCEQMRLPLHALTVYDMCPVEPTTGRDLLTAVGICEASGNFIWKSLEGWIVTKSVRGVRRG